jgi:hypothetical protein
VTRIIWVLLGGFLKLIFIKIFPFIIFIILANFYLITGEIFLIIPKETIEPIKKSPTIINPAMTVQPIVNGL